MPIYEYQCKACGRVDEVMQKVDAPAPEACSACQQGPLVKLMSKTGFILKGGGWYVTDFRGGGKPADRSSSGSGGSESGGESGGGKTAAGEAPAASPSTPATPAKTENSAAASTGGGCHGGKCAH